MEREYTYEISTKFIFQQWVIRTYLHNKVNLVVYILAKLIPIMIIVFSRNLDMMDVVLVAIPFFYFEIYITYQYFVIKNRLLTRYGNERTTFVKIDLDGVEMTNSQAQTKVLWNSVTTIKETRWFIFFYKHNLVIGFFYKPIMSQEDLKQVKEVLTELSRIRDNVLLR